MVATKDKTSPVFSAPTDERGIAIDAGYYSTEGELFDRYGPDPGQIDYMCEHESQVAALELAISFILQSAEPYVEEAKGDKGEADRVRTNLFNDARSGGMRTPMRSVLAQMCAAPARKRMYWEKVYGEPDKNGFVTLEKLAFRPPHQCTVMVDTKNGSFNGFRQRAPMIVGEPLDIHLKPDKAFVYVFRSDLRPLEGKSIFQTAYGDYVDKLKISRLHNIHLEKFALGTVIGRYTGRVADSFKKFFKKLKKWVAGGGVMVIGDSESVEVKSHTGPGAEFLEKIRYLDSMMAGSVMLNFLRLGVESNVGSWALAESHRDFFLMLMQAILTDFAASITNYVIAPLVEINFGVDAACPTFRFKSLSQEMEKYASEVWQALVTSATRPTGVLWEEIEKKTAEFFGVPLEKLSEEAEKAGTPTGDAPVPAAGATEDFIKAISALTRPGAPAETKNGDKKEQTVAAENGKRGNR